MRANGSLPSVFDRLVDDEPERPVDARSFEPLTPALLHDVVLRDLRALFNTTCCDPWSALASDERRHAAPRGAECSVLGYGLPALAGRPVSSCDTEVLARALCHAIERFEPRLDARSVLVVPEVRAAGPRQLLRFRIEGRLRAGPWPETLVMRTEIDLDNGMTRVTEQA